MAARQVELAVDFRYLFGFPGDADLLHPVHGRIGMVNQAFSENRIDAPLADVVEVAEEILPCVSRNLHSAKALLRNLRKELTQFLRSRVHEAKTDVRELRI